MTAKIITSFNTRKLERNMALAEVAFIEKTLDGLDAKRARLELELSATKKELVDQKFQRDQLVIHFLHGRR